MVTGVPTKLGRWYNTNLVLRTPGPQIRCTTPVQQYDVISLYLSTYLYRIKFKMLVGLSEHAKGSLIFFFKKKRKGSILPMIAYDWLVTN
jgi:hypothetical protein